MKVFSAVRYRLLIAALIVPLAACGTQTTGNPESATATTPKSTDVPVGSDSPPAEGTGPQTPGKSGKGGVAISIAQLPIGGNSDSDGVKQCLSLAWLADDIPSGVSIPVTVAITPGIFDMAKGGSGCDGKPNCYSSFAFTSQQRNCSLSLTAKASNGLGAEVTLGGKVTCPSGQEQKCRDFASSASKVPSQISSPRQPEKSQEAESTPTTTSPAASTTSSAG